MKIEFFTDKKNITYVSVIDENNPIQKFEESIEAESPNGKYKVAVGNWYVNNENDENDGDEIADSATLYVFNQEEIYYEIKGIDCINGECILFDDGRLVILDGCPIESPNGLFKADIGCSFAKADISENINDKIDNPNTLYVFNQNEIAYQINGIDYIDDEECFLFDDGHLIVFDGEQSLTMYSNIGKPTKKKAIEYYDYKISNDFAWFYGDSESGKTRVQIIDLDTFSSWTKSLKEEVCSVKNVIRSDDGGFIVIAETYDETEKMYKYTSEGKVSEETLSDRNEIKVKRENGIENKKTNYISSNTNTNVNDSKKKPNIKLIFIIAAIIIVLAIIGATQQ